MVSAVDKRSMTYTSGGVSVPIGEIAPGSIIDKKYHVLRRLGDGGMGQVYEAEHTIMGTRVAVKVMHTESHDNIAAQRFRREARLLASLNHPNIVRITEAGVTDDGLSFVTMELLHGETLKDWVHRHSVEERDALYLDAFAQFMKSVAEGLGEAHAKGVIHRDIKLSNVVLHRESDKPDAKVTPKIIDFGIAKREDDNPFGLTVEGQIPGTLEYMAPEVIRGHQPDIRSDLYSFGVALYEGLCGQKPFPSSTRRSSAASVDSDNLRAVPPSIYNPHVSRGLDKVCLLLLEPDPDARYQSAASLIEVLTKSKGSAKPDKPPVEKMRFSMRKAVFISVFFFAAIGVAAYLLLSTPANKDRRSEEPAAIRSVAVAPEGQRPLASAKSSTEKKSPAPLKISESQPQSRTLPGFQLQDNILKNTSPDKTPQKKTVAPGPDISLEALLLDANKKLDVLDVGGAERLFQKAIQQNPNSGEAWYGLGRVAMEQNDYKAAKARMETALEKKSSALWRIHLGTVLERMGRTDEAAAEWQWVLDEFPDDKVATKEALLHLKRHGISQSEQQKGALNEK